MTYELLLVDNFHPLNTVTYGQGLTSLFLPLIVVSVSYVHFTSSDNKSELEKKMKEILEGSGTNERITMSDEVMGRGKRMKKRKYPSDAADETQKEQGCAKQKKAAGPAPSSACKNLMDEILQKEDMQATSNQGDEVIKNLQEEISILKEEKKQLRSENKNLRKTIRLITNLPELLTGMQNIMEEMKAVKCPLSSGEATQKPVKEFPSQGQQEDSLSTKLSRLVNRCNTKEPTKLVNDLLTGLFDDQYLASHTITGATFKGYEGLQKEKMDPMTVNAIIETVTKFFPDRTPSEVKHFMRQKLANSSKTVKRRKTDVERHSTADKNVFNKEA